MYPVMMRPVSFRATSTYLVCTDASHTGAAYSATAKHSSRADERKTQGSAPHVVPINLWMILFLALIFPLRSWQCCLNERVQSSFTPKYLGYHSVLKQCLSTQY